jgi:hypothetical protein
MDQTWIPLTTSIGDPKLLVQIPIPHYQNKITMPKVKAASYKESWFFQSDINTKLSYHWWFCKNQTKKFHSICMFITEFQTISIANSTYEAEAHTEQRQRTQKFSFFLIVNSTFHTSGLNVYTPMYSVFKYSKICFIQHLIIWKSQLTSKLTNSSIIFHSCISMLTCSSLSTKLQ